MLDTKNSRLKGRLLSASMLSGIAALSAIPAHAQDGASPMEEIIVTASKRPQTLQEIPVAVSVITADDLKQTQILDIKDLQFLVPSLRVDTLQSSGNTNFRIRGFGNGARGFSGSASWRAVASWPGLTSPLPMPARRSSKRL